MDGNDDDDDADDDSSGRGKDDDENDADEEEEEKDEAFCSKILRSLAHSVSFVGLELLTDVARGAVVQQQDPFIVSAVRIRARNLNVDYLLTAKPYKHTRMHKYHTYQTIQHEQTKTREREREREREKERKKEK